jgi:hypothetical protein
MPKILRTANSLPLKKFLFRGMHIYSYISFSVKKNIRMSAVVHLQDKVIILNIHITYVSNCTYAPISSTLPPVYQHLNITREKKKNTNVGSYKEFYF